MYYALIKTMIHVLLLLIVVCGTTNVSANQPQTATSDNVEKSSHGTNLSSPAICQPVPLSLKIARAKWKDPDKELFVIGKYINKVKSDKEFEIIYADLILTKKKGACMLEKLTLGELTRDIPDAPQGKFINTLELKIQKLGTTDAYSGPVAFEQAAYQDNLLLIVHLTREVRWGLTERYAVPILIKDEKMIAGDKVQVGRDAMGPPQYYGSFHLEKNSPAPQLVLTRTGMGRFPKRVIFNVDSSGAFRASESLEHPQTTLSPLSQDGQSLETALRECGPEGVKYWLALQNCSDGKIKNKGRAGYAADGHIVDLYSITCTTGDQSTEKTFYADSYHCKRGQKKRLKK